MLRTEHELPRHKGAIVTDGPDCIGDGSDYVRLLKEISQITERVLVLEDIQCRYEDNKWELSFMNNDRKHEISLEISEYFDNQIITKLNQILQENNPDEKRKLFTLEGGPHYDFGVCFATLEYEIELADSNLIWRSGGWKETQSKLKSLQSNTAPKSDNGEEMWVGHFNIKGGDEITMFKIVITERDGNKFNGICYEGSDFEPMKNGTITVHGILDEKSISFDKHYGPEYYVKLAERMKRLRVPIDSFQAPTQDYIVKYSGSVSDKSIEGQWTTEGSSDGTFYDMPLNVPNNGFWKMDLE